MFKIKMDEAAKKRVSEALHIQESDEYEMVLCDEAAMMEEGKINLLFSLDQLPQLGKCCQFTSFGKYAKIKCSGPRGDVFVRIMDIDYIEAFGNDIYVICNQQQFQMNTKLYKIEEAWKSFGFIRISKSQIVNIGKIEAIQRGFNGKLNLVLAKGELEVNRSFVKEFKAYMEGR